jgi:hypothetical protein
MVDTPFIDIDKVVLSRIKLSGVSVFEVGQLLGIFTFKLALDIVAGLEHSLEVLLSRAFGVQELTVKAVYLVLRAL